MTCKSTDKNWPQKEYKNSEIKNKKYIMNMTTMHNKISQVRHWTARDDVNYKTVLTTSQNFEPRLRHSLNLQDNSKKTPCKKL